MGTDPNDWMWSEACAVLERMERMHRQFFRPGIPGMQSAAWQPPMDVFEAPDGILIVLALPGVERGDIEIAVDGDTLVISGIRHLPAITRGAAIQRLEIPYGRFERHVRLPSGQFDIASQTIENGSLFITLAKRR
ncbi:MAG: Hsp20/alpha crystallin family protein [Xanthobacteraceae bacterium]